MLLYKKRGILITQKQAEDICHFTGGWAVGINSLLFSRGYPSEESFCYLGRFILSNIWEKLDEFMLRTAAARELIPSLCTALTGVKDSEALLSRLMQNGALISKTKAGVYHYHHLFHGFLKDILDERGEEYLFPMLEKEGKWNLSRQDFFSAVECFIRCGNYDNIAKCFMLLLRAPTAIILLLKRCCLSQKSRRCSPNGSRSEFL